MIDKTNETLLDKPSIVQRCCCVCGKQAQNQHHVIAKGMGGTRLAKRIPTLSLCGMGNTSGCHGKAHSSMLHFDYRDGWYFILLDEPTKRIDALGMDGWERCYEDGL